jgi:hypothetical protein
VVEAPIREDAMDCKTVARVIFGDGSASKLSGTVDILVATMKFRDNQTFEILSFATEAIAEQS